MWWQNIEVLEIFSSDRNTAQLQYACFHFSAFIKANLADLIYFAANTENAVNPSLNTYLFFP